MIFYLKITNASAKAMLSRWHWSKQDLRHALQVCYGIGDTPKAGTPVPALSGQTGWHRNPELAYALRWFAAEGYVRFR